MRHSWPVLLVLALDGCTSNRPWTVLPESQTAELRTPCSRAFPEGLAGYWSPKDADIAEVEQKIDAFVTKELRDRGEEGPPPTYRRQYVGFERAGRQVIYVNGHGDWSDSWRTKAVNICDGGVIAFGAVYDLGVHRFDWFQFNGPFNGHERAGPP